MNGSAVLISKRWVRLLALGVVLATVVGLGTHVLLRLRVVYQNQTEIVLLRSEVEELKRRGGGAVRILGQRLDALEASVYGELEPAVRKRAVDAWSANRDRELRERIRRLELRLMQREYLKEQAKK